MAWCPFKLKTTHFLFIGATNIVIFSFFMFRVCVGVLYYNIAATTFSFAPWYVLWVGMWLSFCCFDLAPLVL